MTATCKFWFMQFMLAAQRKWKHLKETVRCNVSPELRVGDCLVLLKARRTCCSAVRYRAWEGSSRDGDAVRQEALYLTSVVFHVHVLLCVKYNGAQESAPLRSWKILWLPSLYESRYCEYSVWGSIVRCCEDFIQRERAEYCFATVTQLSVHKMKAF
jgi:hypothetical protein